MICAYVDQSVCILQLKFVLSEVVFYDNQNKSTQTNERTLGTIIICSPISPPSLAVKILFTKETYLKEIEHTNIERNLIPKVIMP